MLFAAVHWSLMAQSRQSSRSRVCPLLDPSGQRWILARDGLSAYDPTETWHVAHLWRPMPASLADGAGARPDHSISGHPGELVDRSYLRVDHHLSDLYWLLLIGVRAFAQPKPIQEHPKNVDNIFI
jgi:hypothetical protein